MALYSLGNAAFITLHRAENPDAPPPVCQETTLPIDRPGVDGTGVMRMGRRGEPFQMTGGVDVSNRLAADQTQNLYAAMVGAGRYELIWANTSYSAMHATQFIVLNVQVTKIKRLALAAGGLFPPSLFWVESTWTLVAVPSS